MSLRIFFRLVMLALFWGPGFLLVEVAVQDIPPITLMAERVGVATGLLYLILRIQGGTLPRFGPIWRHFALMGLFASALPFGLVSWGQQYIDSALAAMLVGIVPLFTAILAHLSTTDDRLTPVKTAGILLGFSGMAVLLAPTLLSGMQATTWGLMATVVAAASQSIGLVYGRKYLVGLPPLVGPTAQLTMATLYLLPLSLIVERPYTIATPSAMALGQSWPWQL
ncbi:MAG: DMT family transporter [Chloroflexaceae bacterium]